MHENPYEPLQEIEAAEIDASHGAPDVPPGACAICLGPDGSRKKPFTLYKAVVCKRCYYRFINRRQMAFVLDYVGVQFLFFIVAVVIGMALLNEDQTMNADMENKIGWTIWAAVVGTLLTKDGFSGQSPGKWLCGVQAIDDVSGRPCDWSASFRRNLLLLLPLLPLFAAIQMNKGYRVGDSWGRTKVIWKKYAHQSLFAPKGKAMGNSKATEVNSVV